MVVAPARVEIKGGQLEGRPGAFRADTFRLPSYVKGSSGHPLIPLSGSFSAQLLARHLSDIFPSTPGALSTV